MDPRRPIELYLKGHATGDAAFFREAFLPTARIEGHRGGKFSSWSLDEYCAIFTGVPAADEDQRSRTIDSVETNGRAGMARATLDHVAFIFTDYFVLLLEEGQWWIANKVYHGEPKA